MLASVTAPSVAASPLMVCIAVASRQFFHVVQRVVNQPVFSERSLKNIPTSLIEIGFSPSRFNVVLLINMMGVFQLSNRKDICSVIGIRLNFVRRIHMF